MEILGKIKNVPVAPEESFAEKALKGTGGVVIQGLKGAVDAPGNMLSLPVNAINWATGGRTGAYEENPEMHLPSASETSKALEKYTGDTFKPESTPAKWGQELAYDIGSMAPFAIAGSLFGGPVGAAGGVGLGALMKGIYKLGKLPAVAGTVKHGLKWMGASDFWSEMAKLATFTGGSIWGTGKKLAEAEPVLYNQRNELANGVMVDNWGFSKALDHEAEKIISQSGENKPFIEAIVNDLKNMGKSKSKLVESASPRVNFEVELTDALNKKVDLNKYYGHIKEHNTLFSGNARIDLKMPDGKIQQFNVSKKAAGDVGKLKNLLEKHLIEPYANENKAFGDVHRLAEGLHQGQAAMNDAHEFLRDSTMMRRWFSKHDIKKLFFPIGYGGAAIMHSPGAVIGGYGAAKAATKVLDYTNLLRKSAKAREMYGKALLAAANRDGQEVIRYASQMEKLAKKEAPEILGKINLGVPGITDEETL